MSNFRTVSVDTFKELKLVCSKKFTDNRGLFFEAFKEDFFKSIGVKCVQENVSVSSIYTVRGLHYQLNPKALGKLVTCISGSILDVAVDIRRGSPTFGKSYAIKLIGAANSPGEALSLWVPRGFAHGFQALDNNTIVMYKQDEYYSPEHERSLFWNDPVLGISWINTSSPLLSEKDSAAPLLKDVETNFEYEERNT